MEPKLITLSEEQECEIRYYLDEYNAQHIKYRLDGMMRTALGYEAVGSYSNKEDDFEETFFVKRI